MEFPTVYNLRRKSYGMIKAFRDFNFEVKSRISESRSFVDVGGRIEF